MLPSGGDERLTHHVVTTKFVYDHILTRFGCPLIVVTNQGTHSLTMLFIT
jgi:hypothetical protein